MLIFKYGCMSSGKSLQLITQIYHERSKGNKVLVVKPRLDTRSDKITSRIGLEVDIDTDEFSFQTHNPGRYDFIIVDEAQFLSPGWIDILNSYSRLGVQVICYGLKTDFQSNLFEGSKRLLELADKVEEIESTCKYCNNKAIFNMRLVNNIPVFTGESVVIGGDESYKSVCSKCYYELKTKYNHAG